MGLGGNLALLKKWWWSEGKAGIPPEFGVRRQCQQQQQAAGPSCHSRPTAAPGCCIITIPSN